MAGPRLARDRMARLQARDDSAASTLVSLIALLVVIAIALGVYYATLPKPVPAPLRAENGDTLRVDYVGHFPETDRVFDTSQASVASDNATWPKAFSFSWRTSWTALSVVLGERQVVKGFEDGLLGLTEGEAKTITVPPALGYGLGDPSKIFVKPLIEYVPAVEIMNQSAFTTRYRTTPTSGQIVLDPFWGWTATVTVAGDIVTVTNNPTLGQTVRPYGAWDARVLCIDDLANGCATQIRVQHLLNPSAVDTIGAKDSTGKVTFVITSVDPEGGTYTMDYNGPTVGRTLVFQVTVVSLSRV